MINETIEKYLGEASRKPADNTLMKRFGQDMKDAAGASRNKLYTDIAMADASGSDPFTLTGKDAEGFMKWQAGDKNWYKGLK